MKSNYNSFFKIMSLMLAILFVLYVFPLNVIAEGTNPTETEQVFEEEPLEPEFEEYNNEDPDIHYDYNSEETVTPADVVGEVDDLRAETVKHYRLSDGRYVAVDYDTPVHFKDESEKWIDFNNELVLTDTIDEKDEYDFIGYMPKCNDAEIKFAPVSDASTLFRMKYDDCLISFGLQSAASVEPVLINAVASKDDPYAVPRVRSEIKYPGVFQGVDLIYLLDGNNVKEYFVLSEEAEIHEFSFVINAKNVVPSVDDVGNVVFAKEDGKELFTIPKGYMFDSNIEYSDDNRSDKVEYIIEQIDDGGYYFTIRINEEWLHHEYRVFPVMIDPTVVLNKYSLNGTGNIYTEYKNTATGILPSTDWMYVGHTAVNNADLFTYIKVNELPEIPTNCIVCDACFLIYQRDYSQVNQSNLYVGLYETTSTSNHYTHSSTIQDYAVYSSSSNYSFSQYGVTSLARKWYESSTNNNGVVLKAINNTSTAYAVAKLTGCHSPSSVIQGEQPRFVVTYRHTVGLENYYAYESMDLGRAGEVYLNANTGQTVIVNDIFTTNNLACPYTVSLIYNSVYSELTFTNNTLDLDNGINADIHTADYTKMKLGKGWKLNSQISVKEIELPSYDNSANARYLIYCDADGTEHYFVQSSSGSSVYKDEDGLGLKITIVTNSSYGKYKMTDDVNNTTWFDSYGYVASSTDSNGNKITYNYSTSGIIKKLTSIKVQNDGASTVTVASFTYNSNGYLTSIKDQYNRTTTLTYNYDEITSITYPDGQNTTYDYADYSGYNNTTRKPTVIRDNETGRSIDISYETNGIKAAKIREYIRLSSGSVVYGGKIMIAYTGSEKTEITYSGNDGTLETNDDISNVYLFDYWGRCVNLNTIRPYTGKVFGASTAIYTDTSDRTDRTTNRISVASSTGVKAINMLLNPGVETVSSSDSTLGEYYSRKASLESGQIVERSSSYKHHGSYSMRLFSPTQSSSEVYASMQVTGLTEGFGYTFSAYAKPVSFSATGNGGFYLYADTKYGDIISISPANSTDNGWIKLNVTFTASAPTVKLYVCMRGALGSVYYDDLQLVLADDCDHGISLIPNGGFDDTRTLNNWTMSSGASYTSTGGRYETRGISITGAATSGRSATYIVNLNTTAKNTYVYSGWAKANSVPLTAEVKPYKPVFALTAMITYSNGTTEWHSKAFSADCKEWQFLSMAIVPKSPSLTVSSIKLFLSYDYNGGTAYFDNVSLIADNCTAYEYDSNGNVTAVNKTKESQITSTYSGADLTHYASGTGANFEYTYDSAHNVTSVVWDNLTNALTYNAAGLATNSTLSGGTKTISTSATYDSYGKLTSEKDQLDNQTSYTYNTSNGTVSKTTYPDNTRLMRETDSDNNRLTGIYSSDSLTYESKALLSYSNGRVSQYDLQVSDNYPDTVRNEYFNFTYNYFGDLTKLQVGNLTLAQNTYNNYTGALTSAKTLNNKTLYYDYDVLGRPTYIRNGSSTGAYLFRNQYTSAGLVGRTTDYTAGGNLLTVNLFDSINRLTNVFMYNFSDGSFRQNSNYSYDTASRITGTKTVFDFSVGRAYNNTFNYNSSNGLLSSLSSTNSDTITPTYDSLKRVESVLIDHNSHPYEIDYDYVNVNGTRTSSLPDWIEYYDDGTSYMIGFNYTYDELNRVTAIKRSVGSGLNNYASFEYDDFGKLTDATIDGTDYFYNYDATGNIIQIKQNNTVTKTFEYDTTSGWKDRLMKVNGSSLVYSSTAPGLPTTYQNGRTYTLQWNGAVGELTKATVGGSATEFTYFYGGLRKTKKSGGVTKNYYYDSDRLIAEKWSTGAYLLYHYDQNGTPYALTYSSDGSVYSKYYLIKNLHGDVVQLRDVNNSLVANYEYDAWGNLISVKNASGTTITSGIAIINPIRYKGYYYDNETGFYYLKARYYDPANCRFISTDSRIDLDYGTVNLNLFAYCGSDPVNRVDDGGQFWNFVIGAAVGAIIGAVATAVSAVQEGGLEALSSGKTWAKIGVSAVCGAVNGVVAASGVGLLGASATGAITGGIESFAHKAIDKDGQDFKPEDYIDILIDTGIGAVSGFAGGKGAIHGNKHMLGYTKRLLSHEVDDCLVKAGKYYYKMTANYSKKFVIPTLVSLGKGLVTNIAANKLVDNLAY